MLAGRRRLVLRAAVCLALVALGVLFAFAFRLPAHLLLTTGANTSNAGPITARRSLVQELRLAGPMRIQSVEVLLATWGKPANKTNDELCVFDGAGRLAQVLPLPPGSVTDNSWIRLQLQHPLDVGVTGRIFVALSSSDGTAADSITAWTTASTAGGHLYAVPSVTLDNASLLPGLTNAKVLAGGVCTQVLGVGPRMLRAEKAIRLGGLLAFLGLAAGVWWASAIGRWWSRAMQALRGIPAQPRSSGHVEEALADAGVRGETGEPKLLVQLAGINFAKVFLIVGLTWGVALVFLVPPLQNFDELAHYYRAWSVAEGQLTVPASGTVQVPRSVADLPGQFPYVAIATHEAKTSLSAIPRLIWQPITRGMAPSSSFAAPYAPLGYVPQAVGIAIARILGHSPLLSLYLGRLANLLVALMLIFFALRLLPYGRGLMFVLALFPMAMLQMASLSPDALQISGTFFFVALALHYSQKASLDWSHCGALALTAILLLNAKPGYAALSLLAFVIPPSRFATRSRYLVTMAVTVVATVTLAGLIMASAPDSRQINALLYGANNHLNASAQIATLVHHPLGVAGVIDATMGNIGLLLARSSVASYAWGQLNISDTIAVIGWLALVTVFFLREPVPIRPWQRLVLLGTSLILTALITVGFYVTGTPPGSPTVLGLQGRYFLPCVLTAMLGIFGFPYRRRWVVVLVAVVALVLLIWSSVQTLVVFYY